MNFGTDFNSGNETAVPLNLNKGDILNLNKSAPFSKKLILGAGWDVNKSATRNADFDLDISAFMLDKNGRVTKPHEQVVYFGAMTQRGIFLEGDNRTGAGEGDDERIHIDLNDIPRDVESILFNINIYNAVPNKQTFGMVDNSYIRLLDEDNNEKEICRFNLKTDASNATAVVFAQLYRDGSGWNFKAIGDALVVSDLNQLLARYM